MLLARFDENGIDVDALIAHKRGGSSVSQYGEGRAADPDALIDIESEIWIPAARPDVIDAANAGRLRARERAQATGSPPKYQLLR